jgi:hypothetical protein
MEGAIVGRLAWAVNRCGGPILNADNDIQDYAKR